MEFNEANRYGETRTEFVMWRCPDCRFTVVSGEEEDVTDTYNPMKGHPYESTWQLYREWCNVKLERWQCTLMRNVT